MKRYETSQQILRDIEKAKSDADELDKIANSLEAEAQRLFLIENMVEDAKYKLKEVHAYRTRATGLRTLRIQHLKEKLAEFLTMVLPGIGIDDPSIKA